MINSMTGFGSKEAVIKGVGKIRVELRSTNHKFLEAVLHLPEGFLSLEERITKAVEAKIRRGRVICAVSISGDESANVFINKNLLKNYVSAIRSIQGQFAIKDEVSVDTLIRLPSVVSLEQNGVSKEGIWPHLKVLVNQALDNLVKTRQKEGRALEDYLKAQAVTLKTNVNVIKAKFKNAVKHRLAKLKTDEERSSFLKTADITEEIVRLSFHIRNFTNKLLRGGTVGKELDFIAQEMQREANTIGAKSCDTAISGQVIQIKSQIEKIREQLQNIE